MPLRRRPTTTRRARRKYTRRSSRPSRGRMQTSRWRKRPTKTRTRKSILNLTATKKRATMLIATNTTYTTPSGGSTYTSLDAIMQADRTYLFPWICTWRDNSRQGTKYDTAVRTASTCYMRGLKERIRLTTNDGTQWLWRRVCFTWRGSELFQQSQTGATYALQTGTAPGLTFNRVVNDFNNLTSTPGVAARNALIGLIFKGAAGIDWTNYFSAPIDTDLVTLKYDKTTSLASGNQNGKQIVFNRWHPMNKNLTYADDESGELTTPAGASTRAKKGMGDYYVIDMFTNATPQNANSALAFAPEATLYWHEK
uniref:Capsid protein n=1 Tax=Plant associated genomovirus 7 TaxID=2584401 RepID=A0A4Y5QCC3_9VIRU|nr:capsid protein [Plant associated genomovirus 7]QCX29382.1 capsid protein [Plant associated genomovirus 7]QCX29384.1 capsid protein [Plant associated genomovirus 7]